MDKDKNTMWVGHGRIFSEERGLFYHDTDTYYGNSGSSVLDDRGTIYGIHYGGNAQSAVSTRITHNIFNVLANITNRSAEDLRNRDSAILVTLLWPSVYVRFLLYSQAPLVYPPHFQPGTPTGFGC